MGKRAITLFIACLMTIPLAAEVVTIPVGQQAAEKKALERPRRGITKEKVREQFGEPISAAGPVGDPPISSWEYPGFSVYFEYDLVLHSVLKHKPYTDTAGTPAE